MEYTIGQCAYKAVDATNDDCFTVPGVGDCIVIAAYNFSTSKVLVGHFCGKCYENQSDNHSLRNWAEFKILLNSFHPRYVSVCCPWKYCSVKQKETIIKNLSLTSNYSFFKGSAEGNVTVDWYPAQKNSPAKGFVSPKTTLGGWESKTVWDIF